MLTDEQIVTLLSRNGTREEMLQEAARMGMRRAAEVCDKIAGDAEEMRIPVTADDCADAIRAAVGE